MEQVLLCWGLAATQQVPRQLPVVVGRLLGCAVAQRQMVPSRRLTALNPVCQEPIDFPEG